MTHSHHGHAHSHSYSPSRKPPCSPNRPRSLMQERSNGSLHSYSYLESHQHHGHEHSHGDSHSHSHGHGRETSPYVPTPPYSTEPSSAAFEKEAPPQFDSLESPLSNANILPQEYGHHGHGHPMVTVAEPRSKFTSLILPFVLRWPLVHTILADKDSRRIFYFMR
jgi:zinc transporter 5/7